MSATTHTAPAADTGLAAQHPIDPLHGPGKVEVVERTEATPVTAAATTPAEPRPVEAEKVEKVETPVAAEPERTESKREVEEKEPKADETEAAPAAGDDDIPVNAHAGKVGYGPSYAGNSGIADQLKGTEEKIKGKLFHKPELVQQGEERKAGVLAERKQAYDAEHEETAFDKPIGDKKDAPPGGAAGAGAKDDVDPKTEENAATAGTKEKTA